MAGMVVHSQAVQTSLQIVLPFGSVVHSYFIAVHLQMSMVGRLMPPSAAGLLRMTSSGETSRTKVPESIGSAS